MAPVAADIVARALMDCNWGFRNHVGRKGDYSKADEEFGIRNKGQMEGMGTQMDNKDFHNHLVLLLRLHNVAIPYDDRLEAAIAVQSLLWSMVYLDNQMGIHLHHDTVLRKDMVLEDIVDNRLDNLLLQQFSLLAHGIPGFGLALLHIHHLVDA